ncbi:MAG TPA: 50S ribosomal protein L24 [Solirubrobacteraceae bacterium]|nr:50S ribosomal protein L24 [Solirubrobacteraceae bacterium]
MRLRADDTVIVIAGKDKGKTGRILRVDPKNDKVYVEGLNLVKRHQRPVPGRPNLQVGVIEKEGGIHVSNVALLDPKENKPTRVGVTRREDGRRMRVAKRSGTELD